MEKQTTITRKAAATALDKLRRNLWVIAASLATNTVEKSRVESVAAVDSKCRFEGNGRVAA